jgi:hypothetical protein
MHATYTANHIPALGMCQTLRLQGAFSDRGMSLALVISAIGAGRMDLQRKALGE